MGNTVLDVSKLSKKVFMPVVQVREVSRARIMALDEKKKRGITDRDVVLDSVLAGRSFITRKELLENYGEMSGRRIKLRGWRTDKSYSVMGRGGTSAFAVRIPTGYDFNYKGKRIIGGSAYLVCRANENGEPVIEDVRVVKRGVFRKTFTMPINEHIARHADIKMDKPRREAVKVRAVENKPIQNVGAVNTESTAGKAEVVARLVDIERRDIGFIVRDPKGNVQEMPTANVYRMAQKGLLDNATIVKDPNTGKSWLRGVGVKLSDLPKKMVQ